jgi:DNA-directed RNA polymerase subunit H (RpoH/RPB5)
MSLKLAQKKEDIFLSRSIILEMIKNRGFNIDDYSSFTKDDIFNLYNQFNQKIAISNELGPLDILVKKTNEEGQEEKLFVKYKLDDKFKKNKSLEQQIISIFDYPLTKNDCLIIINYEAIEFKPTKKESNVERFNDFMYTNYGYFIQLYGIKNLLFNISKHFSVPKHEYISNKEVQEILLKYNIKINNFEEIRREDPQAKYIGLRPNQVCKITRPSTSSIYSIIYRRCID